MRKHEFSSLGGGGLGRRVFEAKPHTRKLAYVSIADEFAAGWARLRVVAVVGEKLSLSRLLRIHLRPTYSITTL